jgi:uncharacterized membrane protein YhaH (DUF805 family)
MSRLAWGTIAVSTIAAAGDVGLAMATAAAWSPGGPSIPQLAFLAGPFLFLAIMAWRRRHNATRPRLLFLLTLFASIGGLGVLGYDCIRFCNEPPNNHASHSHPLIVPLIQWGIVVAAWVILVVQEGSEKQIANKTT